MSSRPAVFHQEYGAQVISTTPTVPYVFEYSDGRYKALRCRLSFPSLK